MKPTAWTWTFLFTYPISKGNIEWLNHTQPLPSVHSWNSKYSCTFSHYAFVYIHWDFKQPKSQKDSRGHPIFSRSFQFSLWKPSQISNSVGVGRTHFISPKYQPQKKNSGEESGLQYNKCSGTRKDENTSIKEGRRIVDKNNIQSAIADYSLPK